MFTNEHYSCQMLLNVNQCCRHFYKQNIYINLKNALVLSDNILRLSDLLTKLLN